MKPFILAALLLTGAAACNRSMFSSKPEFSARPDPNVATSGTIGSVKATDGTLPIGDNSPKPWDTTTQRH